MDAKRIALVIGLVVVSACGTGRMNLREGEGAAFIELCAGATFDIVVDQDAPDVNFSVMGASASGDKVTFSHDLIKKLDPRAPIKITIIAHIPEGTECPLTDGTAYEAQLPALQPVPGSEHEYDINFSDFRPR